jgi:serine/threonine protein kinase/WD40 repeat protein
MDLEGESVHPDDHILQEFLVRLAAAEDVDHLLDEFCRAHPHLADEFRLHRFLNELESAVDKSAVVVKFGRRFPHLHDEFREHASLQGQLDESADAAPASLQRLGDFRILRRIARGGMGEVYEAIQEPLERRVAVKIIRQGKVSRSARDRFLREQKVLAQLHQTNIVPIHAAGQHGTLQYFAMPFIEGAALHHLIRTVSQRSTTGAKGRTPSLAELAGEWSSQQRSSVSAPDEAASKHGETTRGVPTTEPRELTHPTVLVPGGPPVATMRLETEDRRVVLSTDYFRSVAAALAELADAIQHAHDARVLHRDLKPSNVMVDASGHCWIIDFGLAGFLREAGGESLVRAVEIHDASLQSASGVMGTPAYMAPEQLHGKADVCTDVWGLGIVLYELLALRRPFDAPTNLEIARKIGSQDPAPPRRFVRAVPRDLEAICLKSLSKRPHDRYASAREFAADVRRWLASEPVRARPAHLVRRIGLWVKRNKGWAAAIACTVVAATAGAGVQLARTQAELRERRRAALLEEAHALRQSTHIDGWSTQSLGRILQAAEIRPGDDLKGHAATTLAGLDATTAKLFRDHPSSSVAFSRDGKQLLIGGWNDGAKLWDIAADTVHTSKAIGPGPTAFRADGTPLALVLNNPSDPTALVLWDVSKNRVLGELTLPGRVARDPHSDELLLTYTLADAGTLVAAATVMLPNRDPVIIVWDAASGKQLHRFDGAAKSLCFAPDGSLLAAGDQTGRIVLWTLPDGGELTSLQGGHTTVNALAIHPHFRLLSRGAAKSRASKARRARGIGKEGNPLEGWLLATGDDGGLVTIWDLGRGIPITYCHGSQHAVYSVAFNPDGALLASAGRYSVRIWSVASGDLLLILRPGYSGASTYHSGVTFSTDGNRLAVSSPDSSGAERGLVQIWDLEFGRGIRTLYGPIGPIETVQFSADSRFMAALAGTWEIGIWNLATGQLIGVLDVPPGFYTDNAGWALSPDGGRFAFSAGTEARMWDLANGQELARWTLPPGLQDTLAFHPSGKLLLWRFETQGAKLAPFSNVSPNEHPRIVRLRDLLAPDPLKVLFETDEFAGHVWDIEAPSDGQFVHVSGLGRDRQLSTLRTYDGLTGKLLWGVSYPFRTHGGIHLTACPAGKVLTLFVVVVDARSGKVLFTHEPIAGDRGTVAGAVAPTMRMMVIGGKPLPNGEWESNRGISLAAVETNEVLTSLFVDDLGTDSLFSPDGRRLVVWQTQLTGGAGLYVCDLPQIQKNLARIGLGW